jgi:hypothetical protein
MSSCAFMPVALERVRVDHSRADNGDMISARATRSWRWSQTGGVYLGVGGGLLMLLVAAIAQSSSSVPLLLIGTGWIAMGVVGAWQWRRVAREVRLDDDRISFIFPANEVTIPAGDILEIRRARGDMNHWTWLRFQTRSHGTIKVAARLRGLVDLLSELRRLNPRVMYPDL